jgi:Uncharacterized protein conserved in bacteria (DUF2188)
VIVQSTITPDRNCAAGLSVSFGVFMMSKPQDRVVYLRPDGKWANKRNDASKASTLHDTQAEAVEAAHQMLENSGGGELTVQGRDHVFRCKDTVAPGNDPCPPKDAEN